MQLSDDRVWIDGCFDFTHHGHAGAILQARQTIEGDGGTLICGVHNDREIEMNKGTLPVMTSRERYEHTRANRWCGEVVEDAPYVTQPAWLDRYGCRYVVHGDDITLDANGEDCYQEMKDIGRFRVVKRTNGVSTTEIIHRILTGSKGSNDRASLEDLKRYASGPDGHSRHCYVFQGTLDHVLVEGNFKLCPEEFVLVRGTFDLFHMGQIDQLAQVKSLEGKKIIAVIEDSNDCIMSPKERALSVLSCRHLDGVVIQPEIKQVDYEIDDDRLTQGSEFQHLTCGVIVERIERQRDAYVRRNVRKGMPSA